LGTLIWPLVAPATVPGPMIASSPGYGMEANALLSPRLLSVACVDVEPASTSAFTSVTPGTMRVVRVPSALASALNDPANPEAPALGRATITPATTQTAATPRSWRDRITVPSP
jgi:hypothetical protein